MFGIIYKITNKLNGKIYVGQTTRSVEIRFKEHARCKKSLIGKAMNKYSIENFIIDVLEECETLEQLNEREKFWIATFKCKTPNGYNQTDGGKSSWIPTPEVRAKISAKKIGNKNGLGHRKTAEERAKISVAKSGKNHPLFGKHHSDETRIKMSLARSGKKNFFFGKHLTSEHCSKIGMTERGESPYKKLLNEMDKQQITYTALAKLVGLSLSSISLKMLGKSSFSSEQMTEIKKILGVDISVEELFKRDY